jgi:hypothetical protein
MKVYRGLWVGRLLLFVTLIGFGISPVLAHEDEADHHHNDSYRIFLVTMYPGDELFTGFGHIAFRILNEEEGIDDVYDYGTYDYEDPALGWKFLIGTLKYYCSNTTYQQMLDWYSEDFGGILLQELNLTQEQAATLVARVRHDCLPENAAYKYHHFFNNCSTKLRDILDGFVDGQLGASTKESLADRSLRDLIDASLSKWQFAPTRWLVFGLLSYRIDGKASRWEQMFLPWYLAHEVESLRQPHLPGEPPLVKSSEIVAGVRKGPPDTPGNLPGFVFLVVLFLLFYSPCLVLRRWPTLATRLAGILTSLAGVAAGSYGTLIAFSWAVSPYPETKSNLTMLVLHPLHWLLVATGVGIARRKPWAVLLTARYLFAGIFIAVAVTLASASGLLPQRIWHYGLACAVVSLALMLSVRRTA